MHKLKVFIVDDERLARDELRFLLTDHPETDIVGEADGVQTAIEALRNVNPDVIFLDLQLRGESGLQLLDYFSTTSKVIFVTGFEEQVMEALEERSLFYLLKPVNPVRLGTVISNLVHNS